LIRARARVAMAAAVLACMPGLAAAQAERLRHDLFARPTLSAVQPLSAPAQGGEAAAAEAEAPWNPELIAVMLAGGKSIANLDGVMVRIGESINGYVLVEVGEEQAVLQKGRKRLVVSIRGRGEAPINAQEKQ